MCETDSMDAAAPVLVAGGSKTDESQCERYLLRNAHPPVGVDVSALQLGFHSLPHTDRIRVPLLDSCNTASGRFRALQRGFTVINLKHSIMLLFIHSQV